MDTSDNPGVLFRNTSLTIRLRFTPAIACSTRTRICDSLRLTRFFALVKARPGGFFFRLTTLRDRRLILLKARILVQGGSRRVTQVRLVGDALVMDVASVGPTEEQDPFTPTAHHQDIFVRVRLLLAAVVQGLFFGLFVPLPTPLGAIDNEPRALSGFALLSTLLRAVT